MKSWVPKIAEIHNSPSQQIVSSPLSGDFLQTFKALDTEYIPKMILNQITTFMLDKI